MPEAVLKKGLPKAPNQHLEPNRLNTENNSYQPEGKARTGLVARKVATQILTRVVDDARNLDALCDEVHGLSAYRALIAKDRAMIRAILMIALRRRVQIEAVLKKTMDRKPPKRARWLIHSLHIAITQILFMDIPDSAAVNLGVTAIAEDKRTTRFKNMANAVLRRVANEKEALLQSTANGKIFPDWLAKQIRSDYGKAKLDDISKMLLLESQLDVTTKNNPQEWVEKLDGQLLETGTIRISNKTPVSQLEGFSEGAWWVQDAAASIPATLLGDVSGKSVLDLCAAPGGKTAQIAARGGNVTALDVSAPRLKRLQENLDRLKLKANLVEADILEWQCPEPFDAALLDAPCSSTGTIRRHPDIMWTKTRDDIDALVKLQYQLILKAKEFVRPGGILVFSNCSLLKSEGENLLAQVMKECDDLKLLPLDKQEFPALSEFINGQGAIRTLPFHLPREEAGDGGLDGFFACRFEKR
ncbi:MAG: MFS transporter [Hyphomicrobiales bacterium]|nr:MAG: MFS transporter [Hyphomicrobiales bacterium]